MRDYHAFILDKFSSIYSAEEILRIHKTTNEIRLFFLYICVNLMMQQFYLGSKWYADFDNFSDAAISSIFNSSFTAAFASDIDFSSCRQYMVEL